MSRPATIKLFRWLCEVNAIEELFVSAPDGERIYTFKHEGQTVTLRAREARSYFNALGREHNVFLI